MIPRNRIIRPLAKEDVLLKLWFPVSIFCCVCVFFPLWWGWNWWEKSKFHKPCHSCCLFAQNFNFSLLSCGILVATVRSFQLLTQTVGGKNSWPAVVSSRPYQVGKDSHDRWLLVWLRSLCGTLDAYRHLFPWTTFLATLARSKPSSSSEEKNMKKWANNRTTASPCLPCMVRHGNLSENPESLNYHGV